MVPPCERCIRAGVVCMKKAKGSGCWRCGTRKVGCSVVGLTRKGKKEIVSEPVVRGRSGGIGGDLGKRLEELLERLVEGAEQIGGALERIDQKMGKLVERMGNGKEKENVDEEMETEVKDDKD